MSRLKPLFITGANAVTPVGRTGDETARAVKAGLSGLHEYEDFTDEQGDPIVAGLVFDPEDHLEPSDRILEAAERCLRDLLLQSAPPDAADRPCHLWLAAGSPERPGSLCETPADEVPTRLAAILRGHFHHVTVHIDTRGQAATFFSLQEAASLLDETPHAIAVLGGVDSLLEEQNLEWLDDESRLRSNQVDREGGVAPSEAAAFLLVERAASGGGSLGEILAVGTAVEAAPRGSVRPSTGRGLTEAIRSALETSDVPSSQLDAVVCDLDGETLRAREWVRAETLLLPGPTDGRRLVRPAASLGTVGAAFPAVLLAIVACGQDWLDGVTLVFGSDDQGGCGAAVVRRRRVSSQPVSGPA